MSAAEVGREALRRIAEAKEKKKTCGCRENKNLRIDGESNVTCIHYSFAAIFPEYVKFWLSNVDPRTVGPRTNKEFLMACKRQCGSEPLMTSTASYVKSKGCDSCTGKSRRSEVVFERSVAANAYLLSLWSPRNMDPPTRVFHRSSKSYLWLCKEGHEWSDTPSAVFQGNKCGQCRRPDIVDAKVIQEKFKATHGDLYMYDWSTYKSTHEKMTIICRTHGPFMQRVSHHYSGRGCPLDGTISFDEIVLRARSVWGNTYEYSPDGFTNTEGKITIICPKHGSYRKRPSNHIYDGQGCPTCSAEHTDSCGIRSIKRFLDLASIRYETEKSFSTLANGRYRYDFYIQSLNLIIEFDGQHHFMPVKSWGGEAYQNGIKERDSIKNEYAVANGINLLRIPFWVNISDLIYCLSLSVYRTSRGEKLLILYQNSTLNLSTHGYNVGYWTNIPDFKNGK